jgi:formate/nitrite transporter FocA (FNT family)
MFERVKKLAEKVKARAHDLMGKALEVTGALIAVSVGIGYVAAPIFFSTNTTTWDTTSKIIFPVLFVLGLVVVLFGLLQSARAKGAE